MSDIQVVQILDCFNNLGKYFFCHLLLQGTFSTNIAGKIALRAIFQSYKDKLGIFKNLIDLDYSRI